MINITLTSAEFSNFSRPQSASDIWAFWRAIAADRGFYLLSDDRAKIGEIVQNPKDARKFSFYSQPRKMRAPL